MTVSVVATKVVGNQPHVNTHLCVCAHFLFCLPLYLFMCRQYLKPTGENILFSLSVMTIGSVMNSIHVFTPYPKREKTGHRVVKLLLKLHDTFLTAAGSPNPARSRETCRLLCLHRAPWRRRAEIP